MSITASNFFIQEQTHIKSLVHTLNKLINTILTVSRLTALNEMASLLSREPTSRVRKTERPQKVIGLLEVGSNSENLVDQIFNTDDAVGSEGGLNVGVVVDGESLLVDLGESSLVDELADGLQVGVTNIYNKNKYLHMI